MARERERERRSCGRATSARGCEWMCVFVNSLPFFFFNVFTLEMDGPLTTSNRARKGGKKRGQKKNQEGITGRKRAKSCSSQGARTHNNNNKKKKKKQKAAGGVVRAASASVMEGANEKERQIHFLDGEVKRSFHCCCCCFDMKAKVIV